MIKDIIKKQITEERLNDLVNLIMARTEDDIEPLEPEWDRAVEEGF